MEITKSEIKFKIDEKLHIFFIYNNFPNKIEDDLHSWLGQTDDYSDVSLCDYINKKESGNIAYNQDLYDLIFDEDEDED